MPVPPSDNPQGARRRSPALTTDWRQREVGEQVGADVSESSPEADGSEPAPRAAARPMNVTTDWRCEGGTEAPGNDSRERCTEAMRPARSARGLEAFDERELDERELDERELDERAPEQHERDDPAGDWPALDQGGRGIEDAETGDARWPEQEIDEHEADDASPHATESPPNARPSPAARTEQISAGEGGEDDVSWILSYVQDLVKKNGGSYTPPGGAGGDAAPASRTTQFKPAAAQGPPAGRAPTQQRRAAPKECRRNLSAMREVAISHTGAAVQAHSMRLCTRVGGKQALAAFGALVASVMVLYFGWWGWIDWLIALAAQGLALERAWRLRGTLRQLARHQQLAAEALAAANRDAESEERKARAEQENARRDVLRQVANDHTHEMLERHSRLRETRRAGVYLCGAFACSLASGGLVFVGGAEHFWLFFTGALLQAPAYVFAWRFLMLTPRPAAMPTSAAPQ